MTGELPSQPAPYASPAIAEAYLSQGVAFHQQGRIAEASLCYQQALAYFPDYPEAHNNLGAALQAQGDIVRALACYEQAVRLQPGYIDALKNLGGAYRSLGRLDEAIPVLQQVLRLLPDLADVHNTLGVSLHQQGRVDEAVACFREALRLQPAYAEARNNLGSVVYRRGNVEEALACYEEVLRLKPDFAEAHLDRAFAFLQAGDFQRGWPEYEWRWHCENFTTPPLRCPQPTWDGSDPKGKTILLRAEQGLGDAIQFIRYAPLVKQRGGRVIVECQPPLASLIRTCQGIDQVIARGPTLPPFDVHVLLMSVPGILGTTVDNIPADVPYLAADPALVERWRGHMSGTGLKVGIAWQGNPEHNRQMRVRAVTLAHFAPLARVHGVRLFSLQVGAGRDQLTAPGNQLPVTDLGGQFDLTSFGDAAAVLKNLDLVIAIDTAAAHLAGALAVPVWVALPFACDWRWLRDREDSPWYPTMRLFRQNQAGSWDEVFERMARELSRGAGRTA
jgi:Flp pilus assembly protein TadD